MKSPDATPDKTGAQRTGQLAPLANVDVLQQWHADIHNMEQAQAALQESASFFNALPESMLMPVFYKDTLGRYIGMNRTFELLNGGLREALSGRHMADFAPPDLAWIYKAKDMD